jgi:predicted PurR-regulated permease PerM
MIKDRFNRWQFITSVVISCVGLMFLNSFFSFDSTIDKINNLRKSGLLFYTDSNDKINPVTTLAEWKIKRYQILEGIQQAMGKLPSVARYGNLFYY